MKGIESTDHSGGIKPTGGVQVGRTRQHRPATYQKVQDERKRPIRGLWVRNGRYYAQLALEDPKTGVKTTRRVPLEGANTQAQAKAMQQELLVNRRKGKAIVQRRAPTFAGFVPNYLTFHSGVKRASTLETEGYAIDRLQESFGSLHLNQIKRLHLDHFISSRQKAGVSARTINLEITVLRNVLNHAIDQELIHTLPTENLRPLKRATVKRELTPVESIEKLCTVPLQALFHQGRLAKPGEAGSPLLNAIQFIDYIRVMCYCGSRLSETLRLQWSNVDWAKRQLTIGADGMTKNGQSRVVDFNENLEKHLSEMYARRTPGSKWLFPSPRGGQQDVPAKTFRESLLLARAAAGLPKFAFHDCRHFFISYCVMAGIDYMTIARWVGHQDGGILIGKVYGHLSDEHAKRQASKLSF